MSTGNAETYGNRHIPGLIRMAPPYRGSVTATGAGNLIMAMVTREAS